MLEPRAAVLRLAIVCGLAALSFQPVVEGQCGPMCCARWIDTDPRACSTRPRCTEVSSAAAAVDSSTTKHVLQLGLMLPLSDPELRWPQGWTIAGAASLAVDSINADPDLLPHHELNISWTDSGCSEALSMKAFLVAD